MPAETVYIFDACAIIALLDAEPGAEVVETLLAEEHRFQNTSQLVGSLLIGAPVDVVVDLANVEEMDW